MNPPTVLSLALREGWYALVFYLALWLGMAWLLERTGASDVGWMTVIVVLAMFEREMMP